MRCRTANDFAVVHCLVGGAGGDFFDGGAGYDRARIAMLELTANIESSNLPGLVIVLLP